MITLGSRAAGPRTLLWTHAASAPVLRSFHTTRRVLKGLEHENRIAKEEKKLLSLQRDIARKGISNWYSLATAIARQQTKLSILRPLYATEKGEPKQTIQIAGDAQQKATIDRFTDAYRFMATRFFEDCEASQNLTAGSMNEQTESILNGTIEAFKKEHPAVEPLSRTEVEQAYETFFRLSNRFEYLEDLSFSDAKVQSLLESYLDTDFDEPEKATKAVSEKHQIAESVVEGWFEYFHILSAVPYSKDDQVFHNAICGMEYTFYKDAVKNGRFSNGFFNSEPEPKQEKGKPKPSSIDININLNSPYMRYFQIGLFAGLVMYVLYRSDSTGQHEITFQEFSADFLRKNIVQRLRVVNNKTVYVELNDRGKSQYPHGEYYFTIGSVEAFERNLINVQDEYNIADLLRMPVVYASEGSAARVLFNLLPTVLFLGAIWYMGRKATMGGPGGPLGFGKSTAKKFNLETDVKVKFKDVAGMNEAKQEVMEFVNFLKNPAKYEKLGAKIPRGAILSGPPGTGKTLIAKATAGEAGVPFYSVSGSEFVEMFVGVGASRVRDLFKTARENAPAIVFVDEIDAIGKQRTKNLANGANEERESTLNQLLVEMDGFDTSDHVVVLAGTNRPDILDKALMRPGRFDRHIAIDNPELEGRKDIFKVHLRKITLTDNIDKDLPGRLAALTPGFSGADIANVCNEAALIAARFNAKAVTLRHFELAIERVIGGIEKKSMLLDADEKKIVAYHEAGHAVCGWFLKHAHPLLKVSIIPRGQGALGYAQYLPPDQYLVSAAQLYDRMIMTLGGRVSEELTFSSVTSGAHDDFKKVTNVAQSMVMRFGMSDKVGLVNYADTANSESFTKPFSDETSQLIDEEVKRIVSECYQKCTALLTEKAHEVKLVAEELLTKEFITREDMIRLLGKRPFPENNDAFDKYLDGEAAFKNEKPSEEKKDDEL